jgi:nitrite reductase (NADH) small subunit
VPVLACPWHGWEFDIRTGKLITGEAHSVRTYPVRVRGGRIEVEVPARR